MTSSVSGQDEPKPALLLASLAGKMDLSFIYASLWTSPPSRSINMQKKNFANIQPS